MRYAFLATLGILLAASPAGAFQVGERVMGKYGGMNYWYPATIKAIEGGELSLSYDDGSQETVNESRVRAYGWRTDRPHECQFGESWIKVNVSKVEDTSLTVTGPKGDSQVSPVAKCRTEFPLDDPKEAARNTAAAEQVNQMLTHKKVRVDETKVDCDKAEQITPDEMAAYNANPMAAIMKKADKVCTYAQTVFQKAKPAKGLPQRSKLKDMGNQQVLGAVKYFWENSSDAEFVKVLGVRVTGTKWIDRELSDAPGVPSTRQLGVAQTYQYKDACYVVYGHLQQRNGNHPRRDVPPSWFSTEYLASDYQRPERIDCKKASGM